MPKRKKGNQSRYSIAAKRKQAARNAETDVEKEERCAANAARQRASRGASRNAETDVVQDERRAADADRHRASLSAEHLTDDGSGRRDFEVALCIEGQHCRGQFFFSERLARSGTRRAGLTSWWASCQRHWWALLTQSDW